MHGNRLGSEGGHASRHIMSATSVYVLVCLCVCLRVGGGYEQLSSILSLRKRLCIVKKEGSKVELYVLPYSFPFAQSFHGHTSYPLIPSFYAVSSFHTFFLPPFCPCPRVRWNVEMTELSSSYPTSIGLVREEHLDPRVLDATLNVNPASQGPT